MQCPSCHFENIPGQASCGRCQAHLSQQALAIDVYPPRATTQKKRIRRWLPSIWGARERLRKLDGLTQALFPRLNVPDVPRLSIFCRMVIPGWAHRYCGYPARGSLFFFPYLVFLLGGLLFFGTGTGSLLLGLAIFWHAASILDLVAIEADGPLQRFGTSLVLFAVLLGGVYFPAWRVISLVAEPMVVSRDAFPLEQNDVLLISRLREPRVGDVVVYVLPQTIARGLRVGGANANIAFGGQGVDRILAGPRQTVVLREGRLLVDGQPSAWSPLNPQARFQDFSCTLAPSQWLVLPSTIAYAEQVPESLYQVFEGAIRGVVILRSHPLSRIGRLTSTTREAAAHGPL